MFSLEQLPESGTTPRTTPTRVLRPAVTGPHVPDSSGSLVRLTLSGGACSS
nr:MAG TPA: hypothetical protein [Caudoviricetes sp.]